MKNGANNLLLSELGTKEGKLLHHHSSHNDTDDAKKNALKKRKKEEVMSRFSRPNAVAFTSCLLLICDVAINFCLCSVVFASGTAFTCQLLRYFPCANDVEHTCNMSAPPPPPAPLPPLPPPPPPPPPPDTSNKWGLIYCSRAGCCTKQSTWSPERYEFPLKNPFHWCYTTAPPFVTSVYPILDGAYGAQRWDV